MISADDFLNVISHKAELNFKKSQSILSFNEYMALVLAEPHIHLRNSAQYFVDMINSYGSYDIETPIKKLKRYRLFDADFSNQEGKIFGQEQVQHELVANITNFIKSGRIDKLLLLHGPNGSAKTSIIQALIKGAEEYAKTESGCLYQFSWIFPKKDAVNKALGFNAKDHNNITSYAYLHPDEIDARLSDQRDHPLLLLSQQERDELFTKINDTYQDKHPWCIPEILRIGELSFKNRQIFDSLLSGYNGNLSQVFRHIRIERFYFSRRYKKGISVVEPQMSVDAELRQISHDQSLLSLPKLLNHITMYEVLGPLAEANRGLIEYSDLLKRPLEAFKYLLVSCEQAQVSIGSLSLFFDLLMIATSNELHLASFREYPDWPSFKGRIELIRTPYLLRSVDEEGIYRNQFKTSFSHMHIAPHSIALAARWATLTRLEPPNMEKFPPSLHEIIKALTPSEKLEIYNSGEVPSWLSQKQASELRSHFKTLFYDHYHNANYEGRYGASPREMKMIILNAASDPRFPYLSVTAIFDQIHLLLEQKSSYDFLRREPVRGFKDATYLFLVVKKHYQTILEDEVRSALGLYEKESYADLFRRYILHVCSWTKKERLLDPFLKKAIDADEKFMASIEQSLLAPHESKNDFRDQIIAKIAAFRLENQDAILDYTILFANHLKRLKESLYHEQKSVVRKAINHFMSLNVGNDAIDKNHIQAITLQQGLYKLSYNDMSAREAMAYLLQCDEDNKDHKQFPLPIDT